MSIRWTRRGAVLFFVLFYAAMIWPGMMLGNRTFPLFLGLPFSMVWIASWVILSFLVLVLLDWAEVRNGIDRIGIDPIETGTADSPEADDIPRNLSAGEIG